MNSQPTRSVIWLSTDPIGFPWVFMGNGGCNLLNLTTPDTCPLPDLGWDSAINPKLRFCCVFCFFFLSEKLKNGEASCRTKIQSSCPIGIAGSQASQAGPNGYRTIPPTHVCTLQNTDLLLSDSMTRHTKIIRVDKKYQMLGDRPPPQAE